AGAGRPVRRSGGPVPAGAQARAEQWLVLLRPRRALSRARRRRSGPQGRSRAREDLDRRARPAATVEAVGAAPAEGGGRPGAAPVAPLAAIHLACAARGAPRSNGGNISALRPRRVSCFTQS